MNKKYRESIWAFNYHRSFNPATIFPSSRPIDQRLKFKEIHTFSKRGDEIKKKSLRTCGPKVWNASAAVSSVPHDSFCTKSM